MHLTTLHIILTSSFHSKNSSGAAPSEYLTPFGGREPIKMPKSLEAFAGICLPIVSEFSINSYVENLKKDTLLPTSILRALLEFTQVRTETAAREL